MEQIQISERRVCPRTAVDYWFNLTTIQGYKAASFTVWRAWNWSSENTTLVEKKRERGGRWNRREPS